MKANGGVEKLSSLLTYLQSERDEQILLGLLNLAFLMCLDDIGTFYVPHCLTVEALESILLTLCNEDEKHLHVKSPMKIRTPVQRAISTPPVSTNPQHENPNSNGRSAFHSKRVFKARNGGKVKGHQPQSANKYDDTTVGEADKWRGSDHVRADVVCETPTKTSLSDSGSEEFVRNVSFLSADVCYNLFGKSSMDIEFSKPLALLLVNRLVTSLVQNSARISTISSISRSRPFVTDHDKSFNFQATCMKEPHLTNFLIYFQQSLSKLLMKKHIAYDDAHASTTDFMDSVLSEVGDRATANLKDGNSDEDEGEWGVFHSSCSQNVIMWSEVWLHVGLIDALCFQSSANQLILSERRLALDVFAPSCHDVLPVAILEALRHIQTPLLMYVKKQFFESTRMVLKQNVASRVDRSVCNVDSFSVNSPTRSAKSAEISHSTSSIRSESGKRRFVLETDTERIGCSEVFLGCLKGLISLTHNCDNSCEAVLDASGLDLLANYLDTLYSIRHQMNEKLIKEICEIDSPLKYGDKTPLDRSLTPNETNLERVVFDGIIFTVTLLTNLMEYSSGGGKYAAYLLKWNFVHTKLNAASLVEVMNKTNLLMCRENDFLKLLILMLLRESSVFMR